MQTIQIEKNLPIPSSGKAGEMKYPFRQMEVGDSFFAPFEMYKPRTADPSMDKFLATIRRSASSQKRGVFSVRKVDGGARVWRVK